MGLRSEWTFQEKASDISAAAQRKATHHREREAWWKSEQEKAQQDLREKGTELREVPISGGSRTTVILDPQRQERVDECRGKVRFHEEQARSYESFVRALARHPDLVFGLKVDDVEFFGMGD